MWVSDSLVDKDTVIIIRRRWGGESRESSGLAVPVGTLESQEEEDELCGIIGTKQKYSAAVLI